MKALILILLVALLCCNVDATKGSRNKSRFAIKYPEKEGNRKGSTVSTTVFPMDQIQALEEKLATEKAISSDRLQQMIKLESELYDAKQQVKKFTSNTKLVWDSATKSIQKAKRVRGRKSKPKQIEQSSEVSNTTRKRHMATARRVLAKQKLTLEEIVMHHVRRFFRHYFDDFFLTSLFFGSLNHAISFSALARKAISKLLRSAC